MKFHAVLVSLGLAAMFGAREVAAQYSPLSDRDGNGVVQLLAFGDSITYGVGDDIPPGDYVYEITDSGPPRGYPSRLSTSLSTPVINAGVPGERLIAQGAYRLPKLLNEESFDTVIIMEGSNDAIFQEDSGAYSRSLQKMINVARASGKGVVLMTVLLPIGIHQSLQPFTDAYSQEVRELALLNNLPLIDMESSFIAACPEYATCALYNLPEGLHPNVSGYDTVASTVLAGLQR